MVEATIQEIKDAGPEIDAAIAGVKKTPVPMMLLMESNNIAQNPRLFLSFIFKNY